MVFMEVGRLGTVLVQYCSGIGGVGTVSVQFCLELRGLFIC